MTKGTLAAIALIVVAAVAHAVWADILWRPLDPQNRHITLFPNEGSLEGPHRVIGDFSYYVDGARSIFDFTLERKFNEKSAPIMGQSRPITNADMPWYAKYVLVLYPHPVFKFGYSLSAAAITGLLPQGMFLRRIPRMVVTNFVLSLGIVLFVYLAMARLSGSPWPGAMAALFVTFDFSFIHNGYRYMSHTTCGLFYLMLALLLFTLPRVGLGVFFAIACTLGFAAMSSSHIYFHIAAVGLAMFVWLCWGAGWRQWIAYGVVGFLGVSLWPAYVIGVERWFHFRRLGLVPFLDQLENYSATVYNLMQLWPLSERQIWDFRVFDIFLPAIVVLLLLGWVLWWWRRSSPPRLLTDVAEIVAPNSKLWVVWIMALAGFATGVVYSQPLSRAMTPNLLMLGMALGYLCGMLLLRAPAIGRVVCVACGVLLVANVAALSRASIIGDAKMDRSIVWPWQRPAGRAFAIDEFSILNRLGEQYFSRDGKVILDGSTFQFVNKPIRQFLDIVDADEKATGIRYQWIFFDPVDLVYPYATTRQFWPQFTPFAENVASPALYRRDYRLIEDIFEAINKGQLGRNDVRSAHKLVWDFLIWDQENSYPLLYLGGARRYMAGLSMANVDFRSVYYFNVDALRRVAGQRAEGEAPRNPN